MAINLFDYFDIDLGQGGGRSSWAARAPRLPQASHDRVLPPLRQLTVEQVELTNHPARAKPLGKCGGLFSGIARLRGFTSCGICYRQT